MNPIISALRAARARHLEELTAFLAIPSISSDPERKADVLKCAEHTAGLLRAAGISDVQLVPTAGHPIVFGKWSGAPGKPTVLVYGHYDVQPVDPLDLWEREPFKPWVKDERIVARGSADDKGQIFAHIKALEAIHKAEGRFPVNLKIIFEGEEEVGSPNLGNFLKTRRSDLQGDVVVVSDTQMWAEGVPAITYGLRGLCYLEIELTGPNRDLHSGTYGGVVANPAEILTRLIGNIKDARGRIQILGFYDKVRNLSAEERRSFAEVPFDETQYKSELGVAELWGEAPFSPLERAWARPTFEVNGIVGGFTGVGAKTVLPAKASAKLSMRLVPDQDPDDIAGLVENYFHQTAPKSVTVKVTRHHGGKPAVVDLKSRFMTATARALKEAFGREPLYIREGGSIPIVADFKELLGLDTILVGFALPDARTHSPNENFHLPTMFLGMESLVRLYHNLAE